jgi:capsular polysaccharide transport system permease protein
LPLISTESSANFVVRRSDSVASTSGMGQMLGFSIGGSATGPDAVMVQEYLLSHNAVKELANKDDLVGIFRRPEADIFSRLWSERPAPERLLDYYQRHIDVQADESSGVLHLTVHSFRPEDPTTWRNVCWNWVSGRSMPSMSALIGTISPLLCVK